MYKVKVLTNDIRWLDKGQVLELNNYRAETFSNRGIVKILKFTGNGKDNISAIEKRIENAKEKIKLWQKKLKEYERLKKAILIEKDK